jgi:hypothetical protein
MASANRIVLCNLLAAPRLAGIVATVGVLTGAGSAVFSPVTATSTGSRRQRVGVPGSHLAPPSRAGRFPDPDGGTG